MSSWRPARAAGAGGTATTCPHQPTGWCAPAPLACRLAWRHLKNPSTLGLLWLSLGRQMHLMCQKLHTETDTVLLETPDAVNGCAVL